MKFLSRTFTGFASLNKGNDKTHITFYCNQIDITRIAHATQ